MEPGDSNQRAGGHPRDADQKAGGHLREATDADGTLEARLVRYPDGPDRVTVHPPGVDGVALLSTWLTADADAFVPLDVVR